MYARRRPSTWASLLADLRGSNMVVPPLAESLEAAKAKSNDPSRCGFDLCRAIVTGIREARAHRPDLMLRYGSYLLQHHASALSHEVWATYEQMYIALMLRGRADSRRATKRGGGADASDMEMSADMKKAQELGDKLRTQFGDSLRIRRLDAMKCEAEGNFDLAKEECDKILEEDPSNLFALKRQVAICRSQGRAAEAARKLTDYLATFCSDHEAWLMLCEIYLAAQVFKKASFCAEELVLINPMWGAPRPRQGPSPTPTPTPTPTPSPLTSHLSPLTLTLTLTLALALARTHTLTLTVGALHDGAVAVNMATRDHGFEEWFEEVWLPSLDKTVQPTRASAEASNRLDITNRTAAISRTLSALTLFLPPVPSPFPLPITTPPSSSRGISRW